MNKIYEFIVNKAKLTKEHEDNLKVDRGFTDKAINKFRLKSCGKYLLDIESELLESFSKEELIKSNVCIDKNDKLHLSPSLLDDRILIPYLNKNREVYFIRPHKLHLKGVNLCIYSELTISREIILTEGELKVIGADIFGFNAIALPGVNTYAGDKFPELVTLLNKFGVREIAIMFDNEIKDDPKFKKMYKANPMVRYDTQYYSYYMAKMLEKEGFVCRIAWLPEGWRVDGKIDIDGALAQGRTAADFKSIVSQSKSANSFVEDLSVEARNIIRKKIAKKFFRSHITKNFGKYVATRKRGKMDYEEIISNFTIKIIATHETSAGIIREMQFIDEFGNYTASFSLAPEQMSGSDGFATFCLSHGNFVWRGNKEDLNNIWESEFLNDDGRHIVEPDHIGWIPAEKMWLFGNVALRGKTELRPDSNHIFWTEKKGFKPIPLGVTSGRNTISEGIPYLHLGNTSIEEIHAKFADTIGGMEANVCVGWTTAVLFMEEIFAKYGCFPFLFVTGRRGSGKSTIGEWLMNFYGIENGGKMASETTSVGIQRYMSYYSSLPFYLDEYRNTKQIVYKNGFLRNAYNRQSAGKGIKSDFGVREAKIRGTLIIAGEETPEDNALLTRCIVVVCSKTNRKENHFNWFMTHKTKFSNHSLTILRNKEELLPKFMEVLNKSKDYFTDKGIDDRTAINYSIILAGHVISMGRKGTAEFTRWLMEETKRVEIDYYDEQAVSAFLEDLVALKTRNLINHNYYELREGFIYLYFHGLYNIWAQEYRKTRGVEPFKSSAIRDYLKEEPGFISDRETQRINGALKKCVSFTYNEAPESIKLLFENGNSGNKAVT